MRTNAAHGPSAEDQSAANTGAKSILILRGFIRAETIAYDKFIECGGNMATAKEKGLLRSEGKGNMW